MTDEVEKQVESKDEQAACQCDQEAKHEACPDCHECCLVCRCGAGEA